MIQPDNILFDKRKLKKLFKEGYKYITFDTYVCIWKDLPVFALDNIKDNYTTRLWISTISTRSELSPIKVNEPNVHIYSIERALQIVHNSSQKEELIKL